MIARIIEFSARNRFFVLLLATIVTALARIRPFTRGWTPYPTCPTCK
ncbi:MAG: hypothetical protein QM770_15440 [Tepidisphaeraceae bacterium]